MLKYTFVVFSLILCCCCAEYDLTEDGRDNKKKKNVIRLWAIILLFIFAKVTVFKVVSVVLLMSVFQKLFALAGLFIPYFMKKPAEIPTSYGPPQEYNNIGYSYGPPSQAPPEPEQVITASQYGPPSITASQYGPPSITASQYGPPSAHDAGGAAYHSWLTSKN